MVLVQPTTHALGVYLRILSYSPTIILSYFPTLLLTYVPIVIYTTLPSSIHSTTHQPNHLHPHQPTPNLSAHTPTNLSTHTQLTLPRRPSSSSLSLTLNTFTLSELRLLPRCVFIYAGVVCVCVDIYMCV